ncbi:MAG TPA: response regulator [Steroidobacteraceae bacterium]|nr:response regulator [Steroidobacteraceae bacterium]
MAQALNHSAPRILLVEDELLVRMFAVDVLEESGFKIEEAGTAQEALDLLAKDPSAPVAAVIDLGLPDRAGDALADEVRKLHPQLPIVIASGRSEREIRDRFATDSRVAALVKPYTASLLLETLSKLGVAVSEPN